MGIKVGDKVCRKSHPEMTVTRIVDFGVLMAECTWFRSLVHPPHRALFDITTLQVVVEPETSFTRWLPLR